MKAYCVVSMISGLARSRKRFWLELINGHRIYERGLSGSVDFGANSRFMIETIGQLKGDFVVLDLGSAHTAGILAEVPGLTNAITLIAVDALLGEAPKAAPTAREYS